MVLSCGMLQRSDTEFGSQKNMDIGSVSCALSPLAMFYNTLFVLWIGCVTDHVFFKIRSFAGIVQITSLKGVKYVAKRCPGVSGKNEA